MRRNAGSPRASQTRSLIVAGVAIAAAIALLGGPTTMAFWNDQATETPSEIDSAAGISLDAEVTAAAFTVGNPGSTLARSADGLIPGIRGQRLTYTMTSGTTDGVQGYIAGTVTAAAKTGWAAVYAAGYLTVDATSSGTCALNLTPSVVGGELTWSFSTVPGATVKPGQTCTVVLAVSIPSVKDRVDVSRALLASRGTTATLNPLADFTANAVLTQVPRAEEK